MRLSQTSNTIMKNIFFHQFLDLKNVAKKKIETINNYNKMEIYLIFFF